MVTSINAPSLPRMAPNESQICFSTLVGPWAPAEFPASPAVLARLPVVAIRRKAIQPTIAGPSVISPGRRLLPAPHEASARLGANAGGGPLQELL